MLGGSIASSSPDLAPPKKILITNILKNCLSGLTPQLSNTQFSLCNMFQCISNICNVFTNNSHN